MSTWLQHSDYTSVDIDHLHNFEVFDAFIDSFSKEEPDALMRKLEASKADSCPWGIGINMSTDYGVHLWREDVEKDTFCVTVKDVRKEKFLGIISVSKDQGYEKGDLSFGEMKKVVLSYYDKGAQLS